MSTRRRSPPAAYHYAWIVAGVCALLPQGAAGQAASPATLPEDERAIIVTALPPPPVEGAFGVERISAATLVNAAAGTLEGALAAVPGFQQFRRSDSRSANVSAQGITLRAIGGNASSRTLLLRDGVPVADAFFGFIPFTALPLQEVAELRITRGSGAGAFGAGALAGVIEVDSIALARRDPLSLDLSVGSRDALQASAAAVQPLGQGHVALSLRHDQGDGFFTTPADQRVPASTPARYRASHAALSAQLPINDASALSARIDLFRDARTLRFTGADSSARGVDASLRATGDGDWQWDVLAWLQARDFSNIVVSATSFRPTLDQRDTPTTGWGAKAELRPPVGAGRTLRIGVDVRSADGVAIEDVLAVSGARTATRRAGGHSIVGGAFVEGDVAFGRWLLGAGARLDAWQQSDGIAQEVLADGTVTRNDMFAARSDMRPSMRGAITWSATTTVHLRAAAYTGFRLPTLNELYRGFTVFPVVTRANPDLSPERLRGAEIGASWQPLHGVRASITAFDNRLADAIANVTIGNSLRERRNIAALRARGIEAAVHAHVGPWQLDAGWAYSDARMRAAPGDTAALPLDGLRPAQSPVHSGTVSIGRTFASGALAQVTLRHIGAQFEDDRNVDRLRPATTIDALVRVPLDGRLAMVVRVENLFDSAIVTRNAAGSIDLGAPRTLWVGLHWH